MLFTKSVGIVSLLVVAGVAAPLRAQTCVENTCFADRGASGQIALGPLNGGPCVLDYDNDGFPDLLIRDSIGTLARLFHNVADPARPGERTFVDVTASSVFASFTGTAASPPAALAADYDNDGWTDVYLMGRRTGDTVSGRLYRNLGNGQFANVTASAGVESTGDSPESASWIDFDLDGWVDLLVAARNTSQHPLRLWRNRGDGSFEDRSSALPPIAPWSRMYSHTWSDFDADGYPDCYMLPTSGPVLLHNSPDPQGGRRFTNVATQEGFTYLGPAPMGISAGDYDNDGDFDVGLSNGLIGVYYENLARGGAGSGARLARRMLFSSIWAWGTLWIDVNNDGLLDHYQAGSVGSDVNYNRLFINLGGGAFEDRSPILNDLFVSSQHALQLDYNNDGRQDILTMNPYNMPAFVSVNENISTTDNHWVKVRLRGDGRRVNSEAIGAVVRVFAGGVMQSREVTSGSSTSSTDDFRQHFGLGSAASVERIEVVWPRVGTIAERTDVFTGPIGAGQVVTLGPRCAADVNGDGDVGSPDLFAFLGEFFAGEADFNRDGATDSRDFFEFLGVFFEGC